MKKNQVKHLVNKHNLLKVRTIYNTKARIFGLYLDNRFFYLMECVVKDYRYNISVFFFNNKNFDEKRKKNVADAVAWTNNVMFTLMENKSKHKMKRRNMEMLDIILTDGGREF